ncbi:MAG: hypothetical protein EB116_11485 [Betaproteobacteria bacterium]|nr:hypothetical protein [Betaproteobacteria bacterium]
MNTIPTIGPDTAIAPRTGSGSPQTPPQQRADAAPAVLADSVAKADPGVLLKLVPPAVPRDQSAEVRPPPQDPLAGLLAALFGTADRDDSDPVLSLPPGVSAEDLPEGLTPQQLQVWLRGLFRNAIDQDEALLQRLAQSIESLPPETQEAIQKASNPAMAQLLKFAALTEAGRREAPARFQGGAQPLAEQPQQAAARLLESLRMALPFQLAAKVQEAIPAQPTVAQPQVLQPQVTQPQVLQPQVTQPQVTHPQVTQPAFAPQPADAAPPSQTVQALSPQDADSVQPMQTVQAVFSQQPADSVQSASNPMLSGPMTAQQAELALRDAMRLLMDGRLQWQGVFTPGVPLQLERSDAWQASRGALGGMEKGSSIRLRLQLPNLGDLELRALGFGGQVSVRIHATESSTPALAKALPELQAKLRDRGLAGAQIALDSL